MVWSRRLGVMAGLLALLPACAPVAPDGPAVQAPPGPAIKVVTTFVPVTLLTRAVAGPCAQVVALIPPQISPHDFQSRPADLVALRQARVLVKNGLGMEASLDKLVAAAGNSRLRTIDSSQGQTLLTSAGHDDHTGTGHDHGRVNPHLWLDPQRAMQQVRTIRDGLIAADPGCAQGYRQRAKTYLSQLDRLDRDLARQLKPYRGKTFVAYHDVTPYFAQRYGLGSVTLVEAPAQRPSPADMMRVVQAVQRTDLKALLSEPQQGPRSFNALARDLGLRVGVFDPLETATPKQAQDPETYIQVMRRNGDALVAAFGPIR
ncbi:MAG: zinc ABC transporter substrate-binding protein [Cyanobacteriota bacterium]|nr:zinc ABC transporter substrate-binding protein [Cyanobacteriota bacterium]